MRSALATLAPVAVVALACLLPRLAVAHAIGLSRGEYRALPDGVQAQMTFDRAELGALLDGTPGDAPEAAAAIALVGETRRYLKEPRRVSPNVEEGPSAECPIGPGSTRPSPAQRGCGEPGTNLGQEVLASAREVIERRIVQRVRIVDRGGLPCPGALADLGPSEQGGVTLTALYLCAGAPETTSAVIQFWDALTPGHRHLALTDDTALLGAGSPSTTSARQIVYERQPRFTLVTRPTAVGSNAIGSSAIGSNAATSPPSAAPSVAESPSLFGWLTLGIEHILGGYDHLLFLLALVIVMPVLKTLAATVSVFTLAHSITLALATLGVVAPPTSWVECAIALSIVYVGLENLTARAESPRFALVFGFGLIHGFGFAGALAELGLPVAAAPGALLSFNAGVELGQLAVLAVVFPLVQRLRRAAWFGPRAVPAFSLATALAGAVWFFERV